MSESAAEAIPCYEREDVMPPGVISSYGHSQQDPSHDA